jgi:hypothetical protein
VLTCNPEECALCALILTGKYPQGKSLKSVCLSYEPPHCADYSTGPPGIIDRRVCVVCKVVVGRSAWSKNPDAELDGTQDGDSLLIESPGVNSELRVHDTNAAVPIYLLVYSNDVSLEGAGGAATAGTTTTQTKQTA